MLTTTLAAPAPPLAGEAGPTWAELVALAPGLAALEAECWAVRPGRRFCANVAWPTYRRRLERLVGWAAPRRADPRLKSAAAYRVATAHLRACLPDCRDCLCWPRTAARRRD